MEKLRKEIKWENLCFKLNDNGKNGEENIINLIQKTALIIPG